MVLVYCHLNTLSFIYIWIRESDEIKCMIIDYESTNGNKKIDTFVL